MKTTRSHLSSIEDCLNWWNHVEEAQDQATEWLWTYKNDRPNMTIGGTTRHETENGGVVPQADPIKDGGITHRTRPD